jgi:ubiquinone/menaquinone biosynthesis C-methylase UbiE
MMAINVLEWTEKPAHVLAEFKRVLKKGGHLCAGILGPTAAPRMNSFNRLYGEETICNTMMPWEFEKLAEESGWKMIGGHGVHKKEVTDENYQGLSDELKQALSFMWVFMLRKEAD